MNRRNWMKSMAAAGLIPGAGTDGRRVSSLDTQILALKLKHTWTTTYASDAVRRTLEVRYSRDGVTGYGEGAPIVIYHENAEGAKAAVESVRDYLGAANPWEFAKMMAEVGRRIEGQYAAKAAIDIAVMDWVGQKLRIPLYRYFGLDPRDAPVTTFSIGIDTPEITRQKVREAEPYPVLKIKVGLDTDEATIAAVRGVTDKPLRVDANEGWKDREVALKKILWLEKQNVEFVEQPMPHTQPDDIRWLKERVRIPIIADEACLGPADVPKCAGVYDGVNVKLDKCGGMLEAHRMIQIARALGLKTMLGCMVSSSISVTATAHLSPLVDYADLDGNLLIANDTCRGVRVERGKLILPDGPGLGLQFR
jgi:L-alanine-DL-glutamate epimerase-like enolase superfamily enzyme